jgi:hypothetical protein
MVDIDELLRSKFSPFRITAESFPNKEPYLIVGDDEEIGILRTELQQQGATDFRTSISLPDLGTNVNSKIPGQLSIASSIKELIQRQQHILFTSRSFIQIQNLLGLEYINSQFDYFHLVKIWHSPLTPNSPDNPLQIKCLYQRPVIDWVYEKMLSGETIFAAELLELYLNLYAPRGLNQMDRINFLKSEVQTDLPNGSMASIFNSGGKLEKSWLLYQDAVTSVVKRLSPKLPLPFWNGENFSGKKIVFRREPGPGDEILYANIFNQLSEDGCQVIIETDERLKDLFTRSFPDVEIIPRQDNPPHSRLLENDIDFQSNFSDPFLIYRNGIDKFPDHGGYLIADLEKVTYWKKYFENFLNTPRIGISWGSLGTGAVTNRFTTKLNQWEHILTQPNVQFFSLEYGDTHEDLAWAEEKLGVKIHTISGLDLFHDLDGLASVISNLDLVISINNINTNLGGALNIPTWEIIPNFWYFLFGTDVDHFFPRSRIFKWVGEQDRAVALNEAGETLQKIMRKVKNVDGGNALFRQLSFREFIT